MCDRNPSCRGFSSGGLQGAEGGWIKAAVWPRVNASSAGHCLYVRPVGGRCRDEQPSACSAFASSGGCSSGSSSSGNSSSGNATLGGRSQPDVVCPLSCGRCTGQRASCLPFGTDLYGEQVDASFNQTREGCQRLCQANPRCVFSVLFRTFSAFCSLRTLPTPGSSSSSLAGGEGFGGARDTSVLQACWARPNNGSYSCVDNWEVAGDRHDGDSGCADYPVQDEAECRTACDQVADCQFYVFTSSRTASGSPGAGGGVGSGGGQCALRKNPFTGTCGATGANWWDSRRTCFRVN
ncbi:hypothetical protein HYH03_018620 [Edaphochlamys debaryana]|uniref:Apple domain-containing protein n=1 Tax=Edaphochlamys debaryana TaxID=47281 RepID=A0A835XJW8_9CHLO|nr:hypothetical protein HYH03_018620 [Edaphochlamys debaryana]|eukprot:KAG2482450.1 hypothetical protein HYH03_018620 [Edaphochlamys debaryana]